jgi:hypothetical protein
MALTSSPNHIYSSIRLALYYLRSWRYHYIGILRYHTNLLDYHTDRVLHYLIPLSFKLFRNTPITYARFPEYTLLTIQPSNNRESQPS